MNLFRRTRFRFLNRFMQLGSVFAKYLLAGGIGFVIDYFTLFFCFNLLGLHYLFSSAVGFIAGLVFVYIASNKWVFSKRSMERQYVLEFIIFSVIGLIGLGLTLLLMWALVDIMDLYPMIAKIFTTAIVLIWNFAARKIILYT